MKDNRLGAAFWVSCGILVLILDSKTAVQATLDGVDLCLKTLVPALFPFIFLSILLTNTLSGTEIRVLRPIGRLLRIPPGTEGLLIPAFLGGYPAGAQSISYAYERNTISRDEARRMLSFCNNAGPAFLFGMMLAEFPDKKKVWILWIIQILSAVFASFLTEPSFSKPVVTEGNFRRSADIMLSSVKAMGMISGWVIVFRVALTFLLRWFLWLLPVPFQVLVAGLLELSNGCLLLSEIQGESLRFLLASGMLSFGGLCVMMQTKSVSGALFGGSYVLSKCIQTGISILLAAAVLYPKAGIAVLAILLSAGLIYKRRKTSSISEPVVV